MDLGFLMPWLDLFILLAADRNHCRSVETIEPRINGYAFIFKSSQMSFVQIVRAI